MIVIQITLEEDESGINMRMEGHSGEGGCTKKESDFADGLSLKINDAAQIVASETGSSETVITIPFTTVRKEINEDT